MRKMAAMLSVEPRSWGGLLSNDGRIGIFDSQEHLIAGQLGPNSVSVTLQGRVASGFNRVVQDEVRSLSSGSISLVRHWTERALYHLGDLRSPATVEAEIAAKYPTLGEAAAKRVLIWMDDEQIQQIAENALTPADFLASALATGILEKLEAKASSR